MAGVEEVEVVVAHNERATLRVGGVFLKIEADQTRTDVEVEAMAMAPVPNPRLAPAATTVVTSGSRSWGTTRDPLSTTVMDTPTSCPRNASTVASNRSGWSR